MSKQDAARLKEIENIQEDIRKTIGEIDESAKKKAQRTQEDATA